MNEIDEFFFIGYAGEKNARRKPIDISDLQTRWPDATPILMVNRPKESAPYPATTTVEGSVLYWEVAEIDVAKSGFGQAQVFMRDSDGNVLGKSAVMNTLVKTSLNGTEQENPPPALETWIAKFLEAYEGFGGGNNSGGSSVSIDITLTQPGKAADAKATGDALSQLNEQITAQKEAIDEELDSLSEEIVKEAIPDYWKAHLDEKVAEIRREMISVGFNKSAFLWYTDTHYSLGYKKAPILLKYLYKHTPLDRVNFGGDVADSIGTEENYQYLWDWRDAVRPLPSHHSVPGNHDDGEAEFSVGQIYGYLLAAEETPDIVRGGDGLYYYIDVPSEKTRYLYLDTATAQGASGDVSQREWLKDALVSAPENWHIVAIAHIWRAVDYSVTPHGDKGWSAEALYCLNQFDAYNARGGDYAACTGKVEFCIGGHVHKDVDYYSDGGILVMLTDCDGRAPRGDYTATRGTISESSVNAIIADYEKDEVKVIRIGRGVGRTVTLYGGAGGNESTYTNQLPIATDATGAVYNGIGYKEDTRISSSSGEETTATGWCLSGFIPVQIGDVVRLQNVTFMDINNESTQAQTRIQFYNDEFTKVDGTSVIKPDAPLGEKWKAEYNESGDVIQFVIPSSYDSMTKMRMVVKQFTSESVVTVNEPID